MTFENTTISDDFNIDEMVSETLDEQGIEGPDDVIARQTDKEDSTIQEEMIDVHELLNSLVEQDLI